jgi:hypothetical protein
MESCSSTAIRGISGDEDAASRDLELVPAARAGFRASRLGRSRCCLAIMLT